MLVQHLALLLEMIRVAYRPRRREHLAKDLLPFQEWFVAEVEALQSQDVERVIGGWQRDAAPQRVVLVEDPAAPLQPREGGSSLGIVHDDFTV